MDTWFHNRSKIVQVILLIIPVVNWFTEMFVRWSKYLKEGGVLRFFCCFFVTIVPIGILVGWIDAIYNGITKKLLFE